MRRGARHIAIGFVLMLLGRLAWVHTGDPLLVTVLVMPALSLIVHFGVCHVTAGAWRQRGVACEALFRAPLRSQNLSEFWAHRWNLAFSEMTATAAYRPLIGSIGRGPALVAAFALSGLLHEMAISVPVGAGYGLPLAYFVLHGVLVLVERALARAGRPLGGWVGRTWAIFWVVAPLPLLFHAAFVNGVILPLVGATIR
jgi:alginate O-acetyltransferase complex protein AlgI